MSLIIKGQIKQTGQIIPGDRIIDTFDWATGTVTEQKVVSSDIASGDVFGSGDGMSRNGQHAILTSPAKFTSTGTAYYFSRSGDTWTQQQIISSPGTTDERFGHRVSMSDDGSHAIITAIWEDNSALTDNGAVYYYDRTGSTWTLRQTIRASDGASNDYFGTRASMSGDGLSLLVPASHNDDNGLDSGKVYFFTRSGTTWTQQQIFTTSDVQAQDNVGITVEISQDGQRAIVGAWLEDTGGSDVGAVYYFTRSGNTWTQQQKITHPDPTTSDRFGQTIALSDDGTKLIVGSFYNDTPTTDSGTAYYYTLSGSTWSLQQTINPSNTSSGQVFGSAANWGDNTTVAIHAGNWGAGLGEVFVYKLETGTLVEKKRLVASDGATDDRYGQSISFASDGKTLYAGAVLASGTGAGYFNMLQPD